MPERDQDTVAMFDTRTLKVVKRVQFPHGSLPWMLRVSPNGREIWVQTASGTNVVLDARTLRKVHTERVGRQPVQGAWSPNGKYQLTTQLGESWVAVTDASSYKLIKRVEVGPVGANIAFRPDGKFGYVSVTGANSVAVVDMDSLEVVTKLKVGKQPMGLIVL